MTLSDFQIKTSFWYLDLDNDFPPKPVSFPEEYQDGERLNLVCTQLNMTPYRQKKLVEKWCELLPQMTRIKFLWLESRVNQPLFEAVCKMENLELLNIKWSGIKSISSITKLKKLKYINIGSSTQVESIDPLKEMKNLIVLSIENFKKIRKLDVIGKLTQLEALYISGSMWTTQKVDNIEPLSNLQNLRHLSLGNLRIIDNNLRPLSKIKSLEHLWIDWRWKAEVYLALKKDLPNLKYGNAFDERGLREFAKK